MRKNAVAFLALLLVVAFAGSSLAQIPQPVQIGVKAGLSLANLSGDDIDDSDYRIGVAGGVFAKVAVIPGLTFQPELLYVQKGSTSESAILGDIETTLKLDYIDVGLLLRKSFPTPGISPYVLAGPVVGFVSRAEIDMTDDGDETTSDIKDDVKSMTYSLVVGAGVEFGKMLAEVRYELGLSEFWDEGDSDAKCNSIMLLAGTSF